MQGMAALDSNIRHSIQEKHLCASVRDSEFELIQTSAC